MTPHIAFKDVTVRYGQKVALDNVSLEIPRNQIFGIIGPANSGKTTLLKCINRMIDFTPGARVAGDVLVGGENVYHLSNVFALRRRIGMVFPLPVGLPMSVYDNVAYAPRMAGVRNRDELDGLVETCLKHAALWDEVKDRMHMLGTKLSGGQQQRLTIARALSHRPEILCLDEFSIAVDPVTTMKIEDVLLGLKQQMTIVLVTNLVQQAHRLADHVAFLNNSSLVEVDTPCLMLELDAFERNLERLPASLAGNPVKLRPHAKSHKCPEIARRQIALGAAGVCVQKVSEAAVMVDGGVTDVLIANEIAGAPKLQLLAELNKSAHVAVCADDAGNVAALAEAARAAGVTIDVLVEIDVGAGRCGVQPGRRPLRSRSRLHPRRICVSPVCRRIRAARSIFVRSATGGRPSRARSTACA